MATYRSRNWQPTEVGKWQPTEVGIGKTLSFSEGGERRKSQKIKKKLFVMFR